MLLWVPDDQMSNNITMSNFLGMDWSRLRFVHTLVINNHWLVHVPRLSDLNGLFNNERLFGSLAVTGNVSSNNDGVCGSKTKVFMLVFLQHSTICDSVVSRIKTAIYLSVVVGLDVSRRSTTTLMTLEKLHLGSHEPNIQRITDPLKRFKPNIPILGGMTRVDYLNSCSCDYPFEKSS